MGQKASTETVLANVIPVNSKTAFPHGSPERAMCVSGGGSRALSYSLGVYRALWQLQLTERLQAISSVSGGSWCSSIFMFAREYQNAPIDTETLLGEVYRPAELTMSVLSGAVAPLASGIVNNNSTQLLATIADEIKGDLYQLWPHFISRWLYQNFSQLGNLDAYMALNEEQVARIKEWNPQLEKKSFVTPIEAQRPKQYIINGTLLAPLKYEATNKNAVCMQMSPDYSGCLFYPDDSRVKYPYAPLCPCTPEAVYACKAITRTVGGGVVESFAFGGAAPEGKAQQGGEKVAVGKPKTSLSLCKAVSISSWALAGAFEQTRETGTLFNIRDEYWPVTSAKLPKKQEAITYEFGDGGLTDNGGVIPLLQRSAEKVIWVCNSYRSLDPSYDWSKATPENFEPQAAGIVDQVYYTFGYKCPAKNGYWDNDQVFEKEVCLSLCKEIKRLIDEGKPCIVRRKLKVVPNTWWGVKGGYEVDLLLIYLAQCSDFESHLPTETRAEIEKGAAGPFANYPIYKTEFQNTGDATGLTRAQVNLLASQGYYSVMTNIPEFRDILK
ncbi:unnamed protein product [Effrenium voratum]|uniref:PNPLA domain-containing protein n=1 Tax=Effrenium voratum TaxID=2562239 RepID=A0AA36NJE0_9DINO|nr:unnamed protein product [Effrenium voratum]